MFRRFSQRIVAVSEDLSRITRPACWAFFAAAVVIAAVAANVAWHVWQVPVTYRDFVAGALAWSDAFKGRDYAMICTLAVTFLVVLPTIARVSARLSARAATPAEDSFHGLVAVALIPAAIWFSGLLLTRNESLGLLYLSCGLVAAVLIVTAILISRSPAFWDALQGSDACALVGRSVVALCLSASAGAALAMAISPLGLVWGFGDWAGSKTLSVLSVGAFACTAAIATLLAARSSSSPQILDTRLRRLVIAPQFIIPGLFFVLLPTPWIVEGNRVIGYPITTAAWITIGALILLAYADLYRCTRQPRRAGPGGLSVAVSPVCLIAILLFVKVLPTDPGSIQADDYHVGEYVVTWWSWARHGLIPFWDYAPSRGLVNYLPGALGALVSDGTAAGMGTFAPYRTAMFLLLAFPPIAYAIGKGPAFLALLLMPGADGISEIDLSVTAALCVFCEMFLRSRPAHTLAVWVIMCLALVLIAPGKGALFVLATMPLALVLLRRAWLTEKRRLAALLAVSGGALLAITLLATPLGLMLVGAVRYGLEHSALNTTANATIWKLHLDGSAQFNTWLWAGASAAWIAVWMMAGVLTMQAFAFDAARRQRMLAYSVPIFLLTMLYTMHAAGRIDPMMQSRPGLASIWALALLLPLLLLAAQRPRRRGETLFVFVSAAAVLAPFFAASPSERLLVRSAEVRVAPADAVAGSRVGLPNIGMGHIAPEHLSRLVTIRRSLDRLLDPGETYLDLTNRSAQYFYLDRPPPIEAGAFYNLYNPPGQLRAVTKLQRDLPPAVLAEADNIVFDGGPAGFRAPLLYRFVLLHYVPVELDDRIWLVRPDRLARIGVAVREPDDPREEELSKLDRAFLQADLRWLPFSWGRSYDSLREKMRQVATITDTSTPVQSKKRADGGRFGTRGSSPLIYDISSLHLSGKSAGLLSFAYECVQGGDDSDVLEIRWTTRSVPDFGDAMMLKFRAVDGRFIVPLDAAPRWLLARDLQNLKLGLAAGTSCASFAVTDVVLFQRRAADPSPQRGR